MHPLQTLQGLEKQTFVANGQVLGLHQGQAQVAGQIGVLEKGFVVGAGGEQGDMRRLACGHGAAGLEPFDQCLVGGCQTLNRQRFKGLGKQTRDDQSVFQQVAQARGGLGALRHQPPQAVRTTGQVKGGQAQEMPAHRR